MRTEQQSRPKWDRAKGTALHQNQINRLALDIAETQSQREDIARAIQKAQDKAAIAAQDLLLARQRNIADVPRLQKCHAEAMRAVSARKDELRTCDDRLYDLHAKLGEQHRIKRRLEALGGRQVPAIQLPDWRDDAQLKALEQQEATVREKLAALAPRLSQARNASSAAETMFRLCG